MADLAAILASLVFVIAKSTVERGKLTELVALEFVLTFGDGSSLKVRISVQEGSVVNLQCTYRFDDVVNQFLGLVDFLFGIGHNKAVQVFVLVAGVSGVRFSFSFFH